MNKEKIKTTIFTSIKSEFFKEIGYSAIGCGLLTFLFFFLPDDCWDSPYIQAFCGFFVMTFFIIFLIFNQVNPDNKIFKINYTRNIILISIFSYSIMCFLYFNTHFSTNGVHGDNYYRTTYITQMAESGYPQDYAYKNLSAFVGPLYWYILALIARIFHIKPYRMLKLGMFFLYYILPILMFEVWKKMYSEKISFIISAFSFFLIFNAYSPARMIVIFFIVPYIMYYYENCTHKEFKTKDYIYAGIFGSIFISIYFLYFLLIPIYFIICFFSDRKKLMKNIKHIFIITILMILFSSWFWVPLLKDMLMVGSESHQQNYFALSATGVEFTRYFRISLFGLFLLIGLGYIIKKYKTSEDLKILGNILISVNIIVLLGLIGILFKFPIMHVRFMVISTYVLYISFCIFLVNFIHYLKHNDFLRKQKLSLGLYRVESYFLIALIFLGGYSMARGTSDSDAYSVANEQDVNYHVIDVIDELDYEDKVFLTNNRIAAAYKPIYLFLLPNPYFSHPSALYNERVKFLEDLSECKSSKEFYDEVIDNEFDVIDYFWLEEVNSSDIHSDFIFTVAVEVFPEGRDYYDIVFKRELFDNPRYFKMHTIKGDIIYETKD